MVGTPWEEGLLLLSHIAPGCEEQDQKREGLLAHGFHEQCDDAKNRKVDELVVNEAWEEAHHPVQDGRVRADHDARAVACNSAKIQYERGRVS